MRAECRHVGSDHLGRVAPRVNRDEHRLDTVRLGAKPVESKTDAQYVAELNMGALKTQGDVVTLATRLELGAAKN